MIYLITSGGGPDDPLSIHGYYPNRQLAEDWLSNHDQSKGGAMSIEEIGPGEILPPKPVLYAIVEQGRILFSDACYSKTWKKQRELNWVGEIIRFS